MIMIITYYFVGDLNPESFPTVNAMQCKNGDSCNDMDCLLIHPKVSFKT